MEERHRKEVYQIPDAVWEQIEPLLPPELPGRGGGSPRMDDRKAMEAIFYIFRAGCKWEELPPSLGDRSTIHERFQEWREAGLFQRMWQAGLITYDDLRAFIWRGHGQRN
jgi:putative transposase